ncbi:MAG: type II toxin-antitoxin system YafQ family toxin [Bacteroidaceae bacterium]|nr:type II toxin-antitoxin system YafQ family toxin [Bacteroidaceae bacterium]
MYSINYTHQFKKDMRKCVKRGLEVEEIKTAIRILSETGTLPAEYKPHPLKGDRKGQWECHIEPNWLMTWEQNNNELTLLFLQTGTHADLFGW